MRIPLFSAFWCLLRALENFALADSAVALSTTARHAHNMNAWHEESARCLQRAQDWLKKWERELRDPIPA